MATAPTTRFARRRAGAPNRGFTLTELLAVIAVMGILGAAAAPGITGLVDNQRARSASSDVFTALLRARSEAVRRNIQVTVTPVNDEAWNEGWSINNPGKPEALLVQDAMRNTTIAGPEDVTYLGNGRVSGNATLTFNIASGDSARCIKLDVSGRPTQSKGACPAQA